MSDLISRSRLIEEMKNDLALKYTGDVTVNFISGMIARQNEIIDIIERQPTVEAVPDINVREWIPCSERLPECDTDVLICSGEFVHEARFKDEHFSNAYGMWYKAVTHWMPLPDTYKGE